VPNDDKPINRRRFFRAGFAELLKPLVNAVAPLEKVVDQLGAIDRPPQKPLPPPRGMPENVWLRPPGALPEKRFTDSCSRCGNCVSACPVHAIKIDTSGKRGGGAPFIDADTSACAVCDGLACMQVCPTGALQPTVLADIDMGTAVWREETCLRSRSSFGGAPFAGAPLAGGSPQGLASYSPAGRKAEAERKADADRVAAVARNSTGSPNPTGSPNSTANSNSTQPPAGQPSAGADCRICVDHCPLGEMAIAVKNNEIAVNPLGCIGCGICQQDCPTTPKSIFVIPIGARRR
jgi:ferredoxin